MSFSSIVVAMDFSPASLMALRRAEALRGPRDEIRLVHVIEPAGRRTAKPPASALKDAREKLAKVAAGLSAKGARVSFDVRAGKVADAILHEAQQREADLVIVGSHARGTIARTMLGSVAEEVARRSPAPVLIVREQADGGPYVTRILLAFDDSDAAQRAAKVATNLARRLKAPLEVIHVIDLPLAARIAGTTFSRDDVPEEIVAACGGAVTSIRGPSSGAFLKVRYIAGSPGREIVRAAQPGDIVVCGTHGLTTIDRLVFGSVATKLIRKAPCPVVVVRSAGLVRRTGKPAPIRLRVKRTAKQPARPSAR